MNCDVQRRAIEARRAPALAALRALHEPAEVIQANIPSPTITLTTPPAWAKEKSASTKGTKAKGYAYENKVGKVLEGICKSNNWGLLNHQWFALEKGNEVECFQPDFVIEKGNGEGVILETKLTWVDASQQIKKYERYLTLYGLKCFSVMVVKNLTPQTPKELIVNDFNKIFPNSVLHLWI